MAASGARVDLLSLAQAKAAASAAGVSEQMAPLSVFRVLLRHPDVAEELASTLTTLLFRGNRLDARLRELIIMRIGWRTGSVYEWTQHWRVARGLEIPEADLAATRDWQGAPNLTEADRAVLQATDDTLDRGMIDDATWETCCRHLATDAERIELVVAIGNWTMFSQLLKSLRIPLEEGVEAWPPDGRAPQPLSQPSPTREAP
ncbi:MAG: carboxymuconolactone decarboxylase family protein [Phenylobacterium sp.]|jgi:alkylhydroperoxidase family enzyme|uniref:carboxymuconolactone decarboxylase family protein n=1 Tax=unclassified Phenylobacterium TaxID=2640670 RepID=UPI0008B50E83|nr:MULTISPECIES: carboxymuconolactone decarboxylase family protein [unclassified Phenylobacterium]MBJ7410605.1 carboxymuconolactone decarboxylase family protein [Phenylobacterium sp.]MCR5873689.1 carboxymuconolactone decarboxylase family protein [Phenylobacterium sp. J426]OHB31161.1 MAG: carboxymuconolactone decarboxylase [Phenylobacterium sp. RIFCSPHIGHO2_01_FULL_69_31]TAJ73750.1 MAG: carboxymuconolactone decarboxylase family protein [Phenylobacterium sp.]